MNLTCIVLMFQIEKMNHISHTNVCNNLCSNLRKKKRKKRNWNLGDDSVRIESKRINERDFFDRV